MRQKRGCPFCNCNSTQVLEPTSAPNTSSHAKGCQIECINCGARGPSGMLNSSAACSAWSEGEQGTRSKEPPWSSPHSFN